MQLQLLLPEFKASNLLGSPGKWHSILSKSLTCSPCMF